MATLEEINAIAKKYGQPTISAGGQTAPTTGVSRRDRLTAEGRLKQKPIASSTDRINDVRDASAGKIRSAIMGEGVNEGKSAVTRGVSAVAELASTPLKVGYELLPENNVLTFRSGLKSLGEKVGSGFSKVVDRISDIPVVQKAAMGISKGGATEQALETISGGGQIAGEILGAEGAVKGLNTTAKVAEDVAKATARKTADIVDTTRTSLFGRPKPISTIDDVINEADTAVKSDFVSSQKSTPATAQKKPSEILAASREASAVPSIKEKWAGISPDIKNRISGKQDKLKEYFDVAHARNNFDTLPTPLEHGAKSVDNAVTKMEELLSDTGSDIGSFRQKVGTYKAHIDNVTKIEKTFNDELSKLNLEAKNGVIRQKPGTVKRVNSDTEINALNELFGDLQVVKQSPDLERLIDLRNLFDSKINFAKSSREVSGSLDPLSRNIRKQIADVSAQIVGKSEAENLAKYADFMDAYQQLKSFTDRKAGAEFLLKQVLSERGGTPRQIMQTIKDRTGIDLMDDAVMSSIATDLIGNARQKGLFRQELTKAGLDVESILHGNPSGAISLMLNWGKKALVNEERQFLKAAR